MTQTCAFPFAMTRRPGDPVFVPGETPVGRGGALAEGIGAALCGEGLGLAERIPVTACLVKPAAFKGVEAAAFPEPRPVRTPVRADFMPPGALLELAVVVARPQ